MTARQLISKLQRLSEKELDFPVCIARLGDDGVEFNELNIVSACPISANKIKECFYKREITTFDDTTHIGMDQIIPVFCVSSDQKDLKETN